MEALLRRTWHAACRVPSLLRWLVVVGWCAMIFMLSNQPGLAVSDDPGVDMPLRHVAHIVVYAALTTLVGWALAGVRAPSRAVIAVAGLLALLYGVTDEWHQTFVPSRSGRPEDLIWDGIGVLIGAAVLWLAARAIDRGSAGTT